MTILITGSTGHISSYLVKKFIINYKKNIILLNRNNSKDHHNITINHDLSKSALKLPNEIRYIVHCAAVTPRDDNKLYDLNNNISNNLVESINKHGKIEKLVNFSTISIYNELQNNQIVDDSSASYSSDSYSSSKKASEVIIKKARSKYIYNLRIPGILVNKDTKNFITLVTQKILSEKKIILYNKNNRFNNILLIDDLYEFINHLLLNNFPSGDILLGTSNPISIEEIVKFIANKFKIKAKVLWKSNNKGFHIKINKTINNYEYKPKDTLQTLETYMNKHFYKYVQ